MSPGLSGCVARVSINVAPGHERTGFGSGSK